MIQRPFSRRAVLAAAPGLLLAACAGASERPQTEAERRAEARERLAGAVTVDMHSHDGAVIGVRRMAQSAPLTPVAEPMRQGGLAVACIAAVSDSPTHHVVDRRIQAFRDPAPGELAAYTERGFARLHQLAREQALTIVDSAAAMRAARSAAPGMVVSVEGADFLEGQSDRVNAAVERWRLRHLQLTHYRPNELGDIQTEPPVHDGLTDAGVAVIRRCNEVGVVVDVAHGPLALVKRAAAVTTRPLILSHTALSATPGARSRLISPEHARVIAGTGGVIGIWPPAASFPDLDALARGMARMADVAGVDHVGLGTDMRGLVGPSILDTYADLPGLAVALRGTGFGWDDVLKILGGNYARVFMATVG